MLFPVCCSALPNHIRRPSVLQDKMEPCAKRPRTKEVNRSEQAATGAEAGGSTGCGAKNAAPKMASIEAQAAEDKGSRQTMEDAWMILLEDAQRVSHFAVYDGHGGRHAAEYARAHLHSNVLSAGLLPESIADCDAKAARRAIVEGFKKTDELLLQESLQGGWQDGATAVSVWVIGHMVFVANIGDAKAVLARAEVEATDTLKGVVITRDHKAIFPVERTRIQKSGGYVAENGRLLGRLEVSRAFGDRQFKKVGVTAVPDVHVFEATKRERFLILGCDGLWGVFGPTDAVQFVNQQLKEGVTLNVACKRLVREAVRERRCKDNCTAVLVLFNH